MNGLTPIGQAVTPTIRTRPLAARTTPQTPSAPKPFVPQYGPPTFTGDAAFVLVGARKFGIPQGAQVAFPDDEFGGVVLVLLPGNKLAMLTSQGQVTNLTPRAASGLADAWFGIPDARPPT